jgi:hypothetical protein
MASHARSGSAFVRPLLTNGFRHLEQNGNSSFDLQEKFWTLAQVSINSRLCSEPAVEKTEPDSEGTGIGITLNWQRGGRSPARC